MKKALNIWSFIASIICILLFYFLASSNKGHFSIIGMNSFLLLLFFTIIIFFLGIAGFSGIRNWMSGLRSIATVVFTLGLSVLLCILLFFGNVLNG